MNFNVILDMFSKGLCGYDMFRDKKPLSTFVLHLCDFVGQHCCIYRTHNHHCLNNCSSTLRKCIKTKVKNTVESGCFIPWLQSVVFKLWH